MIMIVMLSSLYWKIRVIKSNLLVQSRKILIFLYVYFEDLFCFICTMIKHMKLGIFVLLKYEVLCTEVI